MRVSDFSFDLPSRLIARRPPEHRRDSRLLCLEGNSGDLRHRHFPDLLEEVRPGDLMVFNNTRVIPARLLGQKASGGRVEVLVERLEDAHRALAHVRASRAPRPGTELVLENQCRVAVEGREGALFRLAFDPTRPLLDWLDDLGHMPLPPYIDRPDDAEDRERYQTVYGRQPGAVAAPTAGLHFDQPLLDALDAKGVERAEVTLHVGAGTFQPVRVEEVSAHKMHAEWLQVRPEVAAQVAATRARGGRVIAVGTTSVRCLETAAAQGEFQTYSGDTEIFIYPGYRWRVVDALITNFHLPRSTLLMLVSAFAGMDNIRRAYAEAVRQEYRFFSYGDAMWLTRRHLPQDHLPQEK